MQSDHAEQPGMGKTALRDAPGRAPLGPAAAPVAFFVLACCCACSRTEPTWPPPPGAPVVEVTVYATAMHSLISYPVWREAAANDDAPTGPPAPAPDRGTPQAWDEWAFGERIWMVEDHSIEGAAQFLAARSGGAFRAMFWPSAGVVEHTRTPVPFGARPAGEDARAWRLRVSRAGFAAMRDHLRESAAEDEPILDLGWRTYRPARRTYHVFHTCHHYVAHALSKAGVPVSPAWCILPGTFWAQLDRLVPRLGGQGQEDRPIKRPGPRRR